MKIDKSRNPYTEVIEAIRELTKENGLEVMADRIVRIKTTVLGERNELLLIGENMDYYWYNDWYEGGKVELLGFINIDEVEVKEFDT